jgi:hypothetical protein
MTGREKAEVAAMWAICGEYFQRPLQDHAVGMYVADVAHLELSDVTDAMQALRRQPGRRQLFLPGDVCEWVRRRDEGPDTESPEVMAGRITGAVSRFGYPNASKARAYVGESAWNVVDQLGGWSQVCGRLTQQNVHVFQAQAREMARAEVERPRTPARARALPPKAQLKLAGLAEGIGLM